MNHETVYHSPLHDKDANMFLSNRTLYSSSSSTSSPAGRHLYPCPPRLSHPFFFHSCLSDPPPLLGQGYKRSSSRRRSFDHEVTGQRPVLVDRLPRRQSSSDRSSSHVSDSIAPDNQMDPRIGLAHQLVSHGIDQQHKPPNTGFRRTRSGAVAESNARSPRRVPAYDGNGVCGDDLLQGGPSGSSAHGFGSS